MLKIKKVQVVPLDENYAKIIDSASTSDDKTKNAYSMRVVDSLLSNVYTQTEINNILEDYLTAPEIYDELDTKVDKAGDTLTGYLDFQNTDVYGAIYKSRDISENENASGDIARLTLGVGYNGESVIENYVDGTRTGRLEVKTDGTIWNGQTNKRLVDSGDFAVVTTTFTSIGIKSVNYPSGFTSSNCVVVSIMYAPSGGTYRTYMGGSDYIIQVAFGSSNITVFNNLDGTATVKFVLMKTS